MAAQPGRLQAAFTAGELAEELHQRTDLKQFYAGASEMTNVESIPQGGLRGMPRSRDLGGVRSALAQIVGTFTSSLGPHTSPAVIAQVTFPEAREVAAVEMVGLYADAPRADCIQVEYLDPGGVWRPIGAAFDVGTSTRTRVAALPPQEPGLATAVRARFVGGAAISFGLASFRALSETGIYGEASARPFTFARDQRYVLVFTDAHVDVWRDGVFVGAARTPVEEAKLRRMVVVQRYDTALLYHPEMATQRLFRDGADHEWDLRGQEFERIPEVDLGGSYAKAPDVWLLDVRFTSGGGAGLRIVYTVNGATTASVLVPSGPSWGAFAIDSQGAIDSLPTTDAGVSVTFVAADETSALFQIVFGGENTGNVFDVSARVVNEVSAGAAATRTGRADPGGEPLFSPSRGYAAAGVFFQDRLVSAGFASRQAGVLASPVGDYFNAAIDVETASGGLLFALDTDGAEAIQALVVSKHLVLFTDTAHYFVSNRALDRTETVNVVRSERRGCAEGVAIVQPDDGLMFVGRNRGIVYSCVYDDVAQAYVSEPISLLATHMIDGIRAAALQVAERDNDAGRYLLVRDDGDLVIGILIKEQDVVGFNRWRTDGAVRDVCVDGANVPHILVDRVIGGATRRRLERLERDLLVDQAIAGTVDGTTVTGLEALEGASVWAVAPSPNAAPWVLGPFLVEDGAIELPLAVASCDVGRWTPPVARTLPVPRDVGGQGVVLKRQIRVNAATLSLLDTTSCAIAANGGRPQDLPFLRAGMPTDAPAPPFTGDRTLDGLVGYSDDGGRPQDLPFLRAGMPTDAPAPPFTGDRTLDGLVGYSDDGSVTITQKRPGRLQVRGVVVSAKV